MNDSCMVYYDCYCIAIPKGCSECTTNDSMCLEFIEKRVVLFSHSCRNMLDCRCYTFQDKRTRIENR